jgi:hypothetical protein
MHKRKRNPNANARAPTAINVVIVTRTFTLSIASPSLLCNAHVARALLLPRVRVVEPTARAIIAHNPPAEMAVVRPRK